MNKPEDLKISGVGAEETTATGNPAPKVEANAEARPAEAGADTNQTNQETVASQPGDGLPTDPIKQRDAFIAQRKEIKELKSQLKTSKDADELFDTARRVAPSATGYDIPNVPGVQAPAQPQFDETDPTTKAFLDKVRMAERKAEAADQRSKSRMEDFEAWQTYPELHPDFERSETQDLFRQSVRSEYLALHNEATMTGKAMPTLKKVADKVKTKHAKLLELARAKGAADAQQTIDAKEIANTETAGSGAPLIDTTANEDRIEALRIKVRRGDSNALMELNKLQDPYFA